ncbi:MAG: 4Fe-4S binding protein [Chromatiales bacterium]|nr:4Fe-4S binding protein [Chromatiales bacterium]
MSSLRDWLRQALQEVERIPEIHGERCVHALVETAQCSACVDTCPRDAWSLDDEHLALDAERCDGCHLCVAACPEGAIHYSGLPMLRQDGQKKIAAYACAEAPVHTGEGRIGCLHAIGVATLIAHYTSGIQTLLTCSADCRQCERNSDDGLPERLLGLNALLASRGLPTMNRQALQASEWGRMARIGAEPEPAPSMNRRQFFRLGTATLIAEAEPVLDPTQSMPDPAQTQRRLPAWTPGQLAAFCVQIDAAACNACGACVRLCPHQALVDAGIDNPAEPGYRIDPDGCTGCGICLDVCDRQAVSVKAWSVPETTFVALRRKKCRSCGAPFAVPWTQAEDQTLCNICRQVAHSRLLYQVFDQ